MGKFRQYGIKFPHFGHTVGMGKRMDSLVAVALGAFAAYLFFLAATGRPLLALALAGLCMLALRRVLKTAARWMERLRKRGARARKRCAKRRVEGWLVASEAEARSDIVHLLAQAYPGEIAAVNGQLIRRDTGALVLAVYWLLGARAYLAAALFMLLLAGLGLRTASAPKKLLGR